MPSLLLLTGPSAGRRYEVREEATIGRSPSCEIPLDDVKVSRRHARVYVLEGRTRVADLGSRNGTLVNGEKIAQELVLAAGDQFQVGATTFLFDPPTKATLRDDAALAMESRPAEGALPRTGLEAGVYEIATSLLSATSEAMVLRRTADAMARTLGAQVSAALLGAVESFANATVVGAATVEVPRALAGAAMERSEVSVSEGVMCGPLGPSGVPPFGVLYVQRADPYSVVDQSLMAAVGRLAGEALASVRARGGRAFREEALVGASKGFKKAVEDARRASVDEGPVLIVGDLGTGKRALAQSIHALSMRALGPFVAVDCRRSPEELGEELFGLVGGQGGLPRASALLRADSGTLLLRQVDSLKPDQAARLARLFEGRRAPSPRGGEEPVDLRLIATSTRPLAELLIEGAFDPALERLLSTTQIEMPPLRSRASDVLPLFDHFAELVARRHFTSPPTLTPDAKRLMNDYTWPRNVEELRLLAERLALLFPGQEVPSVRLPPELQQGSLERPRSLDHMIARLEKEAVVEALREARGKKIRAAEILGISRPTLDKKIADYGITVQKVKGQAPS